jgi:GTP-binding protein EngB required for normal cell division
MLVRNALEHARILTLAPQVDIPGLGFAEAAPGDMDSWRSMLERYLTVRDTVRVIFHLIDARRSLMDADKDCIQIAARAQRWRTAEESTVQPFTYVVALTKSDKCTKTQLGVVRSEVQAFLDGVPDLNCAIPVLITSAVTREGRDDLWRLLAKVMRTPDSDTAKIASGRTH